MKKILTSLSFIVLSSQLLAQNNPIFYGGPGDGHSSKNYLQATINANAGGPGDGWNVKNYLQPIVNANTGGAGDGWYVRNYQQPIVNANTGGAGDGWYVRNYLQPIVNANAGGAGDGWYVRTYLQPTINDNTGGAGDGWSFKKNIPYVGPTNKGGIGDGWASTYHPLSPLPVIFLSFDAYKDKVQAKLLWKMGEDKEVVRFDVERSDKAVYFTKIGEVKQDDAANKNYSFNDVLPLAGHNYYRLKVWKMDGSSEYTNTRLVIFDNVVLTQLKLYPNPASDKVFIELPSDFTGVNTVLNVYDVKGNMVAHEKYNGQHSPVLELNTSVLAAGNYFVHVATDGKAAIARFTVLK